MAATAETETFQIHMPTSFEVPHATTVEEYLPSDQDLTDAIVLAGLGSNDWVSADSLEGVARRRVQVDKESAELLETARQNLRNGHMDKVHYAVNPLTTAEKWLRAKKDFGRESEHFEQLDEALNLDIGRYVAETVRLLTWEYFPPVRQERDEPQGTYTYKGMPLQSMVDNGITPLASAEEVVRRFAERREEVTGYVVGGLGKTMLKAAGINNPLEQQPERLFQITASQCPKEAINDHKIVGYAGKVKKLMVRQLAFDTNDGSRLQSQIGLRGDIITPEVVNEANAILGVIDEDQYLDRTETLGLQMLTKQEGALFHYVALLDHVATRRSGNNTFMGEVVPEGYYKDYASIPAIAAKRQASQKQEVNALKSYIIGLAAKGGDAWRANFQIEAFITERMKDKYECNPDGAEVVFGKETADTFRHAIELEQQGRIQEAQILRQEARENAPNVGGCGSGSCGLKEVNPTDPEDSAAARLLGIKPEDMKEKMVSYDKAWCKGCSKIKKVYYNKKTADAACVQCESSKVGSVVTIGKSEKTKTKSMFM